MRKLRGYLSSVPDRLVHNHPDRPESESGNHPGEDGCDACGDGRVRDQDILGVRARALLQGLREDRGMRL